MGDLVAQPLEWDEAENGAPPQILIERSREGRRKDKSAAPAPGASPASISSVPRSPCPNDTMPWKHSMNGTRPYQPMMPGSRNVTGHGSSALV